VTAVRIGAVYPQNEFGDDPGAIRAYAAAAEELGYAHVLAYDHVLGANAASRPGWRGYSSESPFQEPFVLFGFMAAVTTTLEFATGVLVLPQRQTAVVAKQAATLDVLSGGRLRLGVGIGWNAVEYEALGEDFHVRGARIAEQFEVLTRLWADPHVTFEGRWDRIVDAGINPLPVQRPIPLWFGGHADAAYRRAARWCDGWMPNYVTAADAAPDLEKLHGYLVEEGRDPSTFGLEPRVSFGDGDEDRWHAQIEEWRALHPTHLTVNTMGAGLSTPDAHIDALRRFAASVIPPVE
jgi:probable F420-dependent oxidoreductase